MTEQSRPDYSRFLQEQGKEINNVEQSEYIGQVLTQEGPEQMQPEQQPQQSPTQQPSPSKKIKQQSGSYAKEGAIRLRARRLVFSDKSIRNAFIRKVYSILTMQLVMVGLVGVLLYLNEPVHAFFESNKYATLFVIILNFVPCVVLSCFPTITRVYPTNYIFLLIFTLTNGLLVGLVSIQYRPDSVLLAIGITALICFFLTVFAFQTSIDFTVYTAAFCIVLLVFTVMLVILSFFHPERPVEIIVAGLGVVLFSFILIYDTQLMLGGQHRYAFTPEDYVFAALSLYTDVISLFLFNLNLTRR